MLLYIMNIIYKIHHTCIDRILLDEAASLLIERSIASISKNRLCQYAFAQRADWLLYRLTRVKRDSKIRVSRTVDNRTTWGSRKEDSTSVLLYENSRNAVLTRTWLACASSPPSVTRCCVARIWHHWMYSRIKIAAPARFKVGDSIRVSKYKTLFEKSYTKLDHGGV